MIEYKRLITIFYSKEDESFIAEIPKINVYADGKTIKETLINLDIVLNQYLETLKELNRELPNINNKTTTTLINYLMTED